MRIRYAEQSNTVLDAVPVEKGLTCFIGSGGKTTLIRAIAHELSIDRKVIITTTTKMYPPPEVPFCDGNATALSKYLTFGNAVCAGTRAAENKISVPRGVSFSECCRMADHVLCEADGAKHYPLKIPNTTEPVYPEETSQIICVMGLSGIGRSYAEACFRSDLAEKLYHRHREDILLPGDAAALITGEHGMLWNAPEGVPVTLVLNGADTEKDRKTAMDIAADLENSGIGPVAVISLLSDFGGCYARFC